MRRIHRQSHRVLQVAFLFFLAACAAIQTPPPSEPGPPPRTIKFTSPDQLAHLRVRPAAGRSQRGRIVYIGVYGGEVPPWERARYFIPKDWPPYKNLADEEGLGRIAFHDSLMHVLAL